jgi:hypothetical protein
MHISNNQHACGKTKGVVRKLEGGIKGNLLNVKENYHIYLNVKQSKLILEFETIETNCLFDIGIYL